jgi:hypothetical protein
MLDTCEWSACNETGRGGKSCSGKGEGVAASHAARVRTGGSTVDIAEDMAEAEVMGARIGLINGTENTIEFVLRERFFESAS